MTVSKTEALVAKGTIVAAWLLFAVSIGLGLQAGTNSEEPSRVEAVELQATRQP